MEMILVIFGTKGPQNDVVDWRNLDLASLDLVVLEVNSLQDEPYRRIVGFELCKYIYEYGE